MTTTARNELIDQFAAWLLSTGDAADKQDADRKAWDFVAPAYDEGATLAEFQDAWRNRD